MSADPIAVRYADALLTTAKSDGEVDTVLEALVQLRKLLTEHEPLRVILLNPGIAVAEKLGVLNRLTQETWSKLVRAFVEMVITVGRTEFLPEIAEALQAAVDRDQGRMRVLVRVARPMPAAVLTRLRKTLERREAKQLTMDTEVDPGLLGGLKIQLGHLVIDGSIQRHLSELRRRLKSVKVH